MLELLVILLVLLLDAAYILMLFSINLPQEKPYIKKLPKISLIIAAREGKIVERTLRMLKKIKMNAEIIVGC